MLNLFFNLDCSFFADQNTKIGVDIKKIAFFHGFQTFFDQTFHEFIFDGFMYDETFCTGAALTCISCLIAGFIYCQIHIAVCVDDQRIISTKFKFISGQVFCRMAGNLFTCFHTAGKVYLCDCRIIRDPVSNFGTASCYALYCSWCYSCFYQKSHQFHYSQIHLLLIPS